MTPVVAPRSQATGSSGSGSGSSSSSSSSSSNVSTDNIQHPLGASTTHAPPHLALDVELELEQKQRQEQTQEQAPADAPTQVQKGSSNPLYVSVPVHEVAGSRLSSRRRVMLCYDASRASDYMLQWAFDNLLIRRRDHIILLTIDTPNNPNLTTSQTSLFSFSEEVVRAADATKAAYITALHEAISAICTSLDITVQRFVIEGTNVPKIILDLAERTRCTLLVTASSGRSKLRRFIEGSVSKSIASAATCPVLVVRMPQYNQAQQQQSQSANFAHPATSLESLKACDSSRGSAKLSFSTASNAFKSVVATSTVVSSATPPPNLRTQGSRPSSRRHSLTEQSTSRQPTASASTMLTMIPTLSSAASAATATAVSTGAAAGAAASATSSTASLSLSLGNIDWVATKRMAVDAYSRGLSTLCHTTQMEADTEVDVGHEGVGASSSSSVSADGKPRVRSKDILEFSR